MRINSLSVRLAGLARGLLANKTALVSIMLIIALGIIVYGNSIRGEFIWDDKMLVKDNMYIKNWSHLGNLLLKDVGAGIRVGTNFYRPLQMLTYKLEYSLWKLNVVGYHSTNILLHILVALLIYRLVNTLFKNNLLSFLTSILFTVHPVHTEAVSYISGRSDPLSFILMLLCIIFYIRSSQLNNTKEHTLILLSCLAYLLALLSKESSLIVPLLLLLYHYTFRKKIKAADFFLILGIAFIYILLRITTIKSALFDSPSSTLLERIPGFFVATFNYIRLLLLPFGLHMEYKIRLFSFTDIKTVLGIIIIFTSLYYAFKKRNTDRLTSFSILWFFLALVPVSNIYPVNAYMAEHWLYVPSLGFFMIVANYLALMYGSIKFRTFSIFLACSLLVFYSSLTIMQNNYWKNPINFYERTLEYASDSPRIFNNLGVEYFSLGNNEEAIAMLKKAIESKPDYTEAYYNLGNIYKKLGNREKAIDFYKRALLFDVNYAEVYNNLGDVYNDLGKKEEVIASYKKAIEVAPDYPDAYNNLAGIYNEGGKSEEAIAMLKKAIKLNPAYEKAYYNLGNTYKKLNRYSEAIYFYAKAIKLNPRYLDAYSNLGVVYASIGKDKEAIAIYKKVIGIDPNFIEAYNNLGVAYTAIGDRKEALFWLNKAIEIDKDYANGYKNLAAVYYYEKQYDLAIQYCDKAIELGSKIEPRLLGLLEPFRRNNQRD